MTDAKALICPYCGVLQRSADACAACGTPIDAETRRRTLARMGPWFLRSETQPFMPGCSWEQLSEFVRAGIVTRDSVLRGPTTRQLWTLARRTPGVAHLLGVCHACQRKVDPTSEACPACRASFGAPLDRNALGIPAENDASSAHLDAPDAAALSAFASNDELREGLHEETRRRRTLGGPSFGVPTTAPHTGPMQRLPVRGPDADPTLRRRHSAWLMIGAPVAIVVVTALLSTALALSRSGRPEDNRTRRADDAGAGASSDLAPRSQSAATIPASSRELTNAGPLDARGTSDLTRSAASPTPATPAGAPSDDSAAKPGAASPTTAPTAAAPDPFASIDALLRRARDGSLSRGDRRRALDEATRAIEQLSALSTTPAGPAASPAIAPSIDTVALAQRRAAIDEERRRLDAEIFLRGEGSSK